MREVKAQTHEVKQFHMDTLTGQGWQLGESFANYTTWRYRWAFTGRLSEIVARLDYEIEANKIQLEYKEEEKQFRPKLQFHQTVWLDSTSCNYGGQRPWFLCPKCNRRCGVIYRAKRLFTCRLCNNLAYQSQSEDMRGLLRRKLGKLEQRLGWDKATLTEILRRPQGMHRRTYDRLYEMHFDIMGQIERITMDSLRVG